MCQTDPEEDRKMKKERSIESIYCSYMCQTDPEIRKSGKVNTTPRHFEYEGYVQAILVKNMIKRTWTTDSIPFRSLKIHSLQAAISVSAVLLKPENCTSKMNLNLGQKLSILFTLFRIPIKKLNRALFV